MVSVQQQILCFVIPCANSFKSEGKHADTTSLRTSDVQD